MSQCTGDHELTVGEDGNQYCGPELLVVNALTGNGEEVTVSTSVENGDELLPEGTVIEVEIDFDDVVAALDPADAKAVYLAAVNEGGMDPAAASSATDPVNVADVAAVLTEAEMSVAANYLSASFQNRRTGSSDPAGPNTTRNQATNQGIGRAVADWIRNPTIPSIRITYRGRQRVLPQRATEEREPFGAFSRSRVDSIPTEGCQALRSGRQGAIMSYRLLSQSAGASLLGITVWALVSGLGSVRNQDDVLAVGLLVLAVAGFGGILFLALRLATSGSAIYRLTDDAPRQVARIVAMIICALVVQMAAAAYFDRQGRLGETADAVFFVIWTLVPAIFLGAKIVRWPSRVLRPSVLRLVVIGSIALGLAAAMTSLPVLSAASEPKIQPVSNWPLVLGDVVLGAAAEEIVWRVLLLTALLQATSSRFQAVFLSGVGFAMVHAPLALMQPVLRADWPMLHFAVHAYAPEFLMQAAVGCFLGVVWLRTGSIALIVLTHAVLNLGPALVSGG